MSIETTRDIVIIVLGILHIILTIGLFVGLLIAYLKIRKLTRKVNQYLLEIRKVLAYIRGAVKGIKESMVFFRKEC